MKTFKLFIGCDGHSRKPFKSFAIRVQGNYFLAQALYNFPLCSHCQIKMEFSCQAV